ncbi:MAG: hypothetical protein ACOX3U_06760 [Christensenellales bacterium]|jgi:hypothetical protein
MKRHIKLIFNIIINNIYTFLGMIIFLIISLTMFNNLIVNYYRITPLLRYGDDFRADNLYYVYPKDMTNVSEDTLDIINRNHGVLHDIYILGAQKLSGDTSRIEPLIICYDRFFINKLSKQIIKGRLPSDNNEYYEIITIEGQNEINDIIDINVYTPNNIKPMKCKVVGLMDKNAYYLMAECTQNKEQTFLNLMENNSRYHHYILLNENLDNYEPQIEPFTFVEFEHPLTATEINNDFSEYFLYSTEEIYNNTYNMVKEELLMYLIWGLLTLVISIVFSVVNIYNIYLRNINFLSIHYMLGYTKREIIMSLYLYSLIMFLASILPYIIINFSKEFKIWVILINITVLIIGIIFQTVLIRKTNFIEKIKNFEVS